MSLDSFTCPDCKFITVILARYALADGGPRSIKAGCSDKYYTPRMRRKNITLYYRFVYKGAVFLQSTKDDFVRIPDTCREAWFLYSDIQLCDGAIKEMRTTPDKSMQKLALAPGQRMIGINSPQDLCDIQEFNANPVGVKKLSEQVKSAFLANTSHYTNVHFLAVSLRWQAVSPALAPISAFFQRSQKQREGVFSQAWAYRPSTITNVYAALLDDPVGLALEWRNLQDHDTKDQDTYYAWYDMPITCSGMVTKLIENQPKEVTDRAENAKQSDWGTIERGALKESLHYKEIIDHPAMLKFDEKIRKEAALMEPYLRNRLEDRMAFLSQPKKPGTICGVFDFYLRHENAKKIIQIYAQCHSGMAGIVFNAVAQKSQKAYSGADAVHKVWFGEGTTGTDHFRLLTSILGKVSEDGDLEKVLGGYTTALVKAGKNFDQSFSIIVELCNKITSIEVTQSSGNIANASAEIQGFLNALDSNAPNFIDNMPMSELRGMAETAMDYWNTKLTSSRYMFSHSQQKSNARFYLGVVQVVNGAISVHKMITEKELLNKIGSGIAALSTACSLIVTYKALSFEVQTVAGWAGQVLGVVAGLIDITLGFRDSDYGNALAAFSNLIGSLAWMIAGGPVGIACFIVFSALGYLLGQRYADSADEKLIKQTPWFKPGFFSFSNPIWQDKEFAYWPQLNFTSNIREISKKHKDFAPDIKKVKEEIYKLYCRPYVCSFHHRYGPDSVVVVVKFLMPGYVHGKSKVEAVYADGSESYKYTLPNVSEPARGYMRSLDYEMVNVTNGKPTGCYVLNIRMHLEWANEKLLSNNKISRWNHFSASDPGFIYFNYTQDTDIVSGAAIKLNPVNLSEPVTRYGHHLYSTVYDQGTELRDRLFEGDAIYRDRIIARRAMMVR